MLWEHGVVGSNPTTPTNFKKRRKNMKMIDLEKEVVKELKEDKKHLVKEVLKRRIMEIEKAESLLNKLKGKYKELLNKSIDEVVEGLENDSIRF